jgi:hypothetical protein
MKKLILVVLFLSLAIVFSLSVMAQSGQEDVSVPNTTANEQLQDEAVAYCPFAQDGQAGCYIPGYDGSQDGNDRSRSCCQSDQFQSPPEVSLDEGGSDSAPSQIQGGCCGSR